MKKYIASILLISVVLLVMVNGCKSSESIDITEEIVDSFTQIIDETIEMTETDLERIDKDLWETEVKLLKLERVVSPAMEWAEDEKAKIFEEHMTGSWIRRVDKEWLSNNLKNDCYEVSLLELSILEVGSPKQLISLEIQVTDATTKEKRDWEAVESELKTRKASLEKKRQAVLASGKLSISTFKNVIEHLEEWEIKEINKTIYSVSGPGLGIPSTGVWTYYQETAEIIPADKESMALKKVLAGQS